VDESSAWAPCTKLVPVIARVKLPMLVLEGVMPAMVGVGFISVTALDAVAEEDAVLVAVTVTVFGVGREAGAAKAPVDEIVPREAFPPATPLTDQVTAVFELPDTVAVKDSKPPARMFADAGETVTETDAGATGFDGVATVLPAPEVVAEQPASAAATDAASAIRALRRHRDIWASSRQRHVSPVSAEG
jgi:hypothetical protein